MTGASDTQRKLRAVLLSFVMVTSVFGATVAFSGTTAADLSDTAPSITATDGAADLVDRHTYSIDVTSSNNGDADLTNNGLDEVVIAYGDDKPIVQQISAGSSGDTAGSFGASEITLRVDGTEIPLSDSDITVTADETGATPTAQGSASYDFGGDSNAVGDSVDLDTNANYGYISIDTSGKSNLDGGDISDSDTIEVVIEGVQNVGDGPPSGSNDDFAIGVSSDKSSASSTTVAGNTDGLSSVVSDPTAPALTSAGSINPSDVDTANADTGQTIQNVGVDLNGYSFHFQNVEAAPGFDGSNDQVEVQFDADGLNGLSDTSFSGTTVSVSAPNEADVTGDTTAASSQDFAVGYQPDFGTTFDASAGDFSFNGQLTIDSGIDTSGQSPTTNLVHNVQTTTNGFKSDGYLSLGDGTVSTSSVGTSSQTGQFAVRSIAAQLSDGDGTVSVDVDGGATKNLIAGQASQDLGLLRVRDVSGGNSPLSARTLVQLPSGVAVNESASNIVATTTSGELSITDTTIENGGSTIRLTHSGSSENGQTIRVSGVSVDVASNVTASQTGSTSDITIDFATGEFSSPLVTGFKPGAQFTGGSTAISAGTDGTTLDTGSITGFDITTSTVNNQIGNNTEIVVFANQTNGVSFDTSIDLSSNADNLIDGNDGNVDDTTSGLSLTNNRLTIPVTSNFSAGESITVDASVLAVNTSGTASSGSLFQVETQPVDSTGAVSAEQTDTAKTLDIVKPEVAFGSDSSETLTIGANGQTITEGTNSPDSAISENTISVSDSSSTTGQIAAGTNITLSLNNTGVTFDTSVGTSSEINADNYANDDDDDLGVKIGGGDDTTGSRVDVSAVTVNPDSVQIELGGSGTTNNNDRLIVDDLKFNSSADVSDAANVEVTATTRAGSNSPDVVSTSTELNSNFLITNQRPNVAFNNAGGVNATFGVDNDGESGFEVGSNGDTDGAIDIEGDSSTQALEGTFVNISLASDTGVTFDKTASVETTETAGGDGSNTVFVDTSESGTIEAQNATITDQTIAIGLDTDGGDGLDNGESLRIDSLFLNGTADASNTSLSVTTNTGDSKVTTDFSRIIVASADSPSNLAIDADSSNNLDDFTNGEVSSVQNPQVDNSVAGAVRVQNGGNFGGANVNLEIVETPEGSSGSSLNTTLLTTNQNGEAFYNFTAGDTAGDYVVNVSIDGVSGGINVTYTAQPGGIDGVTVTPIENAIAQDGTGDTAVAALFVNSTDANGNKVTGSSPTVEISADNVGSSEVDSTDNFKNTKGDVSGINSGTFSLDSADGSSVIYVKSSQVEDVTISATISGNSDSGTVTFFDQVSQIDLALNQSTVEVDDTVAAEATLSESDGTTIEVPDVTVNYDDNNGANTTFAGGADSDSASTNDAGVASVNVTAEQLGSSTIDAQSNLRSDSATLNIVENAGAQVQLANVNLDPSSVSANTTNDHDLTFDAVNVSDDGNTDSFTVTIPSAATLERANSVSVVDANGTDVSLSGGPDVSGNEITFDVAPDSSADTRTLSVTANVTVAAPDVENETTADITVDVSDSNNGQASANATLTVEPADAPVSDPVERFDTNGEPGIQDDEVLNAISAFNEGEEGVEAGDVLDVISAFNEA